MLTTELQHQDIVSLQKLRQAPKQSAKAEAKVGARSPPPPQALSVFANYKL